MAEATKVWIVEAYERKDYAPQCAFLDEALAKEHAALVHGYAFELPLFSVAPDYVTEYTRDAWLDEDGTYSKGLSGSEVIAEYREKYERMKPVHQSSSTSYEPLTHWRVMVRGTDEAQVQAEYDRLLSEAVAMLKANAEYRRTAPLGVWPMPVKAQEAPQETEG